MQIVAISGSLRARSANDALLRALADVAPPDVRVARWEHVGELPHFSPDLRASLRAADAVVLSRRCERARSARGAAGAAERADGGSVKSSGLPVKDRPRAST